MKKIKPSDIEKSFLKDVAEKMLANPKNKKPTPTTKRLKQITLTLPRGQRIGQAIENFWINLKVSPYAIFYIEDSEFLKLWNKFIK